MANNLTKAEFEDVLLDVRKAYRLLYLYQRRVMDLVGFIGNYFGFIFENGGPQFSAPPSPKANLDYWAWDYLGMYNYHFNFQAKEFKGVGNVAMQVFLMSDTGFFDNPANKDALNVALFESPEKSGTYIHLVLKSQGRESGDYRGAIETRNTPETGYYKSDEDGRFIIGKRYELSEMINEESARNSLELFREFCGRKNIEL